MEKQSENKNTAKTRIEAFDVFGYSNMSGSKRKPLPSSTDSMSLPPLSSSSSSSIRNTTRGSSTIPFVPSTTPNSHSITTSNSSKKRVSTTKSGARSIKPVVVPVSVRRRRSESAAVVGTTNPTSTRVSALRRRTIATPIARAKDVAPPVMSRAERIAKYGIDAPEALEWKSWNAGVESAKLLTVRNVSGHVVRITWVLPATKHFDMDFPQSHLLNVGMSFSTPVRFRPVDGTTPHSDVIRIMAEPGGSIAIPVRAVLPTASLATPPPVAFGLTAVGQTKNQVVELENTGDVALDVALDTPDAELVSVSPATLSIPPGRWRTATLSFTPDSAAPNEVTVKARFQSAAGSPRSVPITVSGVGKYPFLAIEPLSDSERDLTATDSTSTGKSLHFGSQTVGTASTRSVVIRNLSPVSSLWSLMPVNPAASSHPCFNWSRMSGELSPGEAVTVDATFTAAGTPGDESVTYLLSAPGGNHVEVTLVGASSPPVVAVSTRRLVFDSHEVGKKSWMMVHLRNGSDVSVDYAVVAAKGGDPNDAVWTVTPSVGRIKPFSTSSFRVSFLPTAPINFVRPLAVMVSGQAPSPLDLLGTGFSSSGRPPPMSYRHLLAARAREAAGFGHLPPETLEAHVEIGIVPDYFGDPDDDDFLGAGFGDLVEKKEEWTTASGTVTRFLPPVTETPPQATSAALDTLFGDGNTGSSESKRVSLSVNEIGFGGLMNPDGTKTLTRTLSVTNTTAGKVSIVWPLREGSPFMVTPTTEDVLPGESASFEVSFTPGPGHEVYSTNLCAYAFYKTMRNFRLITDATFTAPWSLGLRVTGHTVESLAQLAPDVRVKPARLELPPTRPGNTMYTTMKIRNSGDTSSHWNVADCPRDVALAPQAGTLAPGQFMLIQVAYNPARAGKLDDVIRIALNDGIETAIEVPVHGLAMKPVVVVEGPEGSGVIRFPPTAVGLVSEVSLKVRNKSEVGVTATWVFPPSLQGTVSAVAGEVELSGCGQGESILTFAPSGLIRYHGKIQLRLDDGSIAGTFVVTGRGEEGTVSLSPSSLDFSTVLVNATETRELELWNPSNVNLRFTVETTRQLATKESEEEEDLALTARSRRSVPGLSTQSSVLKVSESSGIVNARARKKLTVSFCPSQHTLYMYKVCVRVANSDGVGLASQLPPSQFDDEDEEEQAGSMNDSLDSNEEEPATSAGEGFVVEAEVLGTGVFPQLAVTDAVCEGMSKARVWDQLCLSELNNELVSDVGEVEMDYGSTQDLLAVSAGKDKLREVLTRVNWWMGIAEIGAAATVVQLRLSNTGLVPADWSARFPSDRTIEKETWADDGVMTREEASHAFIEANDVVTVSPSRGVIPVGGSVTVKVVYSHEYEGAHRIPIVLRVRDGKQVMLEVAGETRPLGSAMLDFPGSRVILDPVSIGELSPPIQSILVTNPSSRVVTWRVDDRRLRAALRHNHGVAVFECKTPYGSLEPGESTVMQWRFSPVEAKEYVLKVKVEVGAEDSEGQFFYVTLVGQGANPRSDGGLVRPGNRPRGEIPRETQIGFDPCQPVRLSIDTIDLGAVPMGALVKRLVTLTNTSESDTCSWSGVSEQPEGVSIEPEQGVLGPGESVLARLSYAAGYEALVSQLEVRLAVVNENARAIEVEREEKVQTASSPSVAEFNITDRRGSVADVRQARARSPLVPAPATIALADVAQPRELRRRDGDPRDLVIGLRVAVWDHHSMRDSLGEDILKSFHVRKQCEGGDAGARDLICLPRLVTSDDASQGEEGLELEPEESAVVQGVVESLLQEIVYDGDVRGMFEMSPWNPVPYFSQVRAACGHGPPLPDRVSRAGAGVKTLDAVVSSLDFEELVRGVMDEVVGDLMHEAMNGEFAVDAVPTTAATHIELEPIHLA